MVLENPGKCWNWEKKIPGPIPGQENSRPWKVLLKIWVVVLKSPKGGGTSYLKTTGDVPLDGVAFSQLD